MDTFPAEFEAMLSAEGRQLLRGDHPARGALLREPFYAGTDLLDPRACDGALALLDRHFRQRLVTQFTALPSATSATASHGDHLPKVGRMRFVSNDGVDGFITRRLAESCGLLTMLGSASYRAFCEALAGRALEGPTSRQLLAYRQGDSAGPHADHHPGEARMAGGYTDVHLTFCTPGVRDQRIIYAREGHFSEQRSIAAMGTVTAYRLPVWHYTTPLQADSPDDLRWLLLGTFLDAP